MSSMNENLLDKIARADFSMETDFKSVLRKRLFESGANKKSGILQFTQPRCIRQCTVAFSVCARVCQDTNPLFYCIFGKVVE